MVLGRAAELGTVELLWHCVTRILPGGGDTTAELDPVSRSVQSAAPITSWRGAAWWT